MSRRQVLQEDLTKSDRAITCGPLVVRRNVLTGLLKRGEIVQDRQEWPIRYFRLAR